MGMATTAGTLSCPDLLNPVQCVAFNQNQIQCDNLLGIALVYVKVRCLWD
jgi:hypothetical protein